MRRKIETQLMTWKDRDRMPLLLHGARQVGKTYLLMELGRKHFSNTVYVNLETNLSVARYFDDDITPDRLIRFLETTVNEEIIPGKTLIILDEIQSCERALTSLKYFCELAPDYHVAAAGSLLGVALNRESFSFPVGKVESMTLHPLDFEEFMWAMGQDRLAQDIHTCYQDMNPLPEALHNKALDLYHYFLITGGMPASVLSFVKSGKLVLVPTVQNDIFNNYVADMAKYAHPSETVKIRACFNSIPAQLAKENRKFQYKVVQKGGSAALFGASIDWLTQAGIVMKCHKVEHALNPISVYTDLSSFKLYMGDVGLLVMKSGLAQQTILAGDDNLFMGAVTENYIAQALLSNGHTPYYWTSEYVAELDFVIQKETDIIGIEVKKSTHIKSKSLHVFMQKYRTSHVIRFSEKNFGHEGGIRAIPHYAAFCV